MRNHEIRLATLLARDAFVGNRPILPAWRRWHLPGLIEIGGASGSVAAIAVGKSVYAWLSLGRVVLFASNPATAVLIPVVVAPAAAVAIKV